MAVEYGTVAIVPNGEWSVTTQYDVGNLVSYDGSSYVARIKPPAGTLPTDLNYWQVSAQGVNKATTEAVGVVKPDGTTITIDADGTIHGASTVDMATAEKAGIVKASNDIPVAADGTMSISTQFTQAAELANIIAGEAISHVLGKVSKSIAVTMGLDQDALLKNMLTNIDANDQNKIPTAAFIHTLYERIGMGTELTVGSNLTEAVNQVNSDNDYANLNDIDNNVWGTAVRTGRTVIITAVVNKSIPPQSNIIMLPDQYRPSADLKFRGSVLSADLRTAPYVIGADGRIKSSSDLSNSGWTINACYSIQ